MTATKPLEMPLPFVLKQEKEESISEDDSEDDIDDTDSDSISSLQQPSILDKNSLNNFDPSDEFLRLTSMVRRVYFSYLHKSIINNYNVCCKTRELSRNDLKKFASQMELHAVRASLESSLYRQAMLKMISDVKTSTSRHRIHKKLSIFLELPSTTCDAAVQTCDDIVPETKIFPVQEKTIIEKSIFSGKEEGQSLEDRISAIVHVPVTEVPLDVKETEKNPIIKTEPGEIARENFESPEKFDTNENVGKSNGSIGIDTSLNTQEIDENTQDFMMQQLEENLEDMFCESDDSSDLTSLIEKCSGVTKTNLDKEIMNMCQETAAQVKNLNVNVNVSKVLAKTPDSVNLTPLSQESTPKRKLSFTNYKNKKKRALEGLSGEETHEDKQSKKLKGIWFVERIHQVSKLRAKMLELSVSNYRRHGRIRSRFSELFGDDDGEDLEADSPIHIEEHLTACKERIAPWVVKYLMPFYSKKVIQDRMLFKAVAKHLTDMLIIDNTFPEEEYVNQFIKDYFRNKSSIKSQADIYI